MTPCRRLLPLLEPFGDGELEPDKVVEVEQHLVECRLCSERVQLNQATRLSTRQAVRSAVEPSAAFRERLTLALRAEQERSTFVGDREGRGKLLPWRTIVPVAAAAAFTMVYAASTVDRSGAAPVVPPGGDTLVPMSMKSVEQLVDELVNDHANGTAPQVTEPGLVQNLEPQVGVPVRLPSLQEFGARWEGGSVVPVRNQRAAALRYYLSDGHRVTLYVYDSNRCPLRATSSLEPRVVRDQPVFVGTRRGYSIAAREKRGLGYAVASDLDDGVSAELVASIH
jgi:anti-sigma factor RsiW